MKRLAAALLCLLLAAPACAARWTPQTLRAQLLAQDSTGYVGGIGPALRALAAPVREAVARETGSELPACGRTEPRAGQVLSAPAAGASPPVQVGPWLSMLRALLVDARPAVRDGAAWLVGEVGPAAAPLAADLDPEQVRRPAWFTHALGRVGCEEYAYSQPLGGLPAAAFELAGLAADEARTIAAKVHLAAALLERRDLSWPDRWFGALVEDQKSGSAPAAEDVLRLARVAADLGRELQLRLDTLRLMQQLGSFPEAAGEILVGVMNDVDPDASIAAAWVLHDQPGAHDGEAALVLMRRHGYAPSLIGLRRCQPYAQTSQALVDAIAAMLGDDNWFEAAQAAEQLGCLHDARAVPALLEALDHPSWEVVQAAVAALAAYPQAREARARLADLRASHWSGLVRKAAADALDPPPPEPADETMTLGCFHRCLTDHLNASCGRDGDIVDGLYSAPGLGEVDVTWQRARRHPVPDALAALVPVDGRSGYGSNDFLRLGDGWLVASDRWHYDGQLDYIDDGGQVQSLQRFGEDGIALLQSPQLGTVVLARSLFGVGEGGLMATVEGTPGDLRLRYRAALPSPPWGWALAPDGTLLVADPHNAVAVHADGRIEVLACPLKAPRAPPRSLLRLARRAGDAPRPLALREASVELAVREQTSATLARGAAQEDGVDDVARRVWQIDAVYDQATSLRLVGRPEDALALLEGAALTPAERVLGTEIAMQVDAGQVEAALARLAASAPLSRPEDEPMPPPGATPAEERAALDAAFMHTNDRELAFFRATRAIVAAKPEAIEPALAGLAGADDYTRLLRLAGGLPAPELQPLATSSGDPRLWPWPQVIAARLRGQIDEAVLVRASHRRDGRVDAERLCEALVYVGLDLARRGQRRAAKAHFEAAVGLGMRHYTEHTMAALARALLAVSGRRAR